MSAVELLPWHDEIWHRLWDYHQRRRLPHALLLFGPHGIGKTIVAQALAQALLCTHPHPTHGTACGTCPACHLFQAGSHPDFFWLQPAAEQSDPQEEPEGEKSAAAGEKSAPARKKGSRYIVVDQVRTLGEWLTLKPHSGIIKIALLTPADRMNINAANSLLKSLEEPPGASLLILATANPNRLPATIRSRCQGISMPGLSLEKALPWLRTQGLDNKTAGLLLNFAAGGPLAARDLARSNILEQRLSLFTEWEEVILHRKSPVAVAQGWISQEIEQLIAFQWGWAADMIKLTLAPQTALTTNQDLAPRLAFLAQRLGIIRIYPQMERLNQVLRLVRGPTNPNLQLLWEDLLITWRV